MRQVRIRFTTGDDAVHVQGDGEKTHTVPHLVTRDYAGGITVEHVGPSHYQGEAGTPIYIRAIDAKGDDLVDGPGSVATGDGWRSIVPQTGPYRKCHWWPLSVTENMIVPGEIIPIAFGSKQFKPPTATRASWVRDEMSKDLDLAFFSFPRFNELIKQFGDETAGDLADTQRRWGHYFGGPNPSGWYQTVCPKTEGYDNGHYDLPLLTATKYILAGQREQDWYYGLAQVLAHACYGVVHSGSKFLGMARYEKSGDDPQYGARIVGGDWNPSHAKQWLRGLIVWTLLSDHPLLKRALDLRIERLIRDKPSQVWGGAWGARILARYVDDCWAAYRLTGRSELLDRGRESMAHALSLIDATRGYWLNAGSHNTTSPWMNAELAAALWRWHRIGVGSVDDRTRLIVAMETIWDQGVDVDAAGVGRVRYRFFGPEANPGHSSLMGYMIPMLRILAEESESRDWPTIYAVNRAAMLSGIQRETGKAVSYRYAPQGPAWPKALKQIAGGMIR